MKILSFLRQAPRHACPILLFIMVVLFSFGIRSYICRQELKLITATYQHLPEPETGHFVPFTVESAMMYSYSQDVASGRGIAEYDRELTGMDKVKVNSQFTTGLEYFLGYGYRLKQLFLRSAKTDPTAQMYEDDPAFTAWVRWQIRLWTSLTAGFLFLWLLALRCPWPFALFGALLHALSPAAIARYTGQDLVRGEFCLPLITAVFLLAYC